MTWHSRSLTALVALALVALVPAYAATGALPDAQVDDVSTPTVSTTTRQVTIDGSNLVQFAVSLSGGAPAGGGGAQVSCDDTATGLDQSCTSGTAPVFNKIECYVTVTTANRGHYAADCFNEDGTVSIVCDYVLPAGYYLTAGGLPCVWDTTGDILQGSTAKVQGFATEMPVGPWTATLISSS